MAIEERDHSVVEQIGRDSFRYRQIWAKAPLRFYDYYTRPNLLNSVGVLRPARSTAEQQRFFPPSCSLMKLEQLQLKPALDSPRPTIRPFSEGHVSLAQPAVGSGTPSSPYAAGKIFTIDIREASSARAPDTNSWKTG